MTGVVRYGNTSSSLGAGVQRAPGAFPRKSEKQGYGPEVTARVQG
jgi:hypothetical protein